MNPFGPGHDSPHPALPRDGSPLGPGWTRTLPGQGCQPRATRSLRSQQGVRAGGDGHRFRVQEQGPRPGQRQGEEQRAGRGTPGCLSASAVSPGRPVATVTGCDVPWLLPRRSGDAEGLAEGGRIQDSRGKEASPGQGPREPQEGEH